jgi:hypothetical protein
VELRAAEEAVISAARHLDHVLNNNVGTFTARLALADALHDLDQAEADAASRGA